MTRTLDNTEIRGVIFDLDGTLYHLGLGIKARIARRLWRTPRLLYQLAPARDAIRGRDYDDGDALDRALFDELARRAGISPARAARWYSATFLPTFVAVLGTAATGRHGVRDLLAKLRGRGLQLAVLSDYEVVAERLHALRIPPESFDFLGSARQSGALKPSSRPFFMIARHMGLPPEQIVVVGDRDDMDRAGAAGVGMHYLGIAGAHSETGHQWNEICSILGRLQT